MRALIMASLSGIALGAGCAEQPEETHFGLTESAAVIVTSEAGDTLTHYPNVSFSTDRARGTVIEVRPEAVKQTMTGVGTSFTEPSAYVLAHLEPERRREVMARVFGADGANFSLTRTHIGSTDFSVAGRYSYARVAGDAELKEFSIDVDRRGFSPSEHPGVRDPAYDLLPMIQEALAIKASQTDSTLHIVASAWTAPPWMKDIETWFIPGSEANDWQGTGGKLKPEFESTYVAYLVRYLVHCQVLIADISESPAGQPHGACWLDGWVPFKSA